MGKIVSSSNDYTLGSPNLGTKLPMTGASFKWALSEGIGTFATYNQYLLSVTKGGEAAGPEKAKYGRRNTCKEKNENGEWNWVNFECKSCDNCSSEVMFVIIVASALLVLTNVFMILFYQRRCLWDENEKVFVAEERGFHTRSVEEFLPQYHGINTQSRELTRALLQQENLAPKKILRELRKEGIAAKDLPSNRQLNTFKMTIKNDQSETSKHRLRNFHQLKEFFSDHFVTSGQQYEALGNQPISSLLL
jgi:hypothetical protein